MNNPLSNMSKLAQLIAGKPKQPTMSAFSVPSNEGTLGANKLKDPRLNEEDNLNLDQEEKDWQVLPLESPAEAIKVADFVRGQFETAQRARQEMETEWALSVAFFEGRQWFRINSNARNLVRLQNHKEPTRYVVVNKIRPLIDGVVGKLTQGSPDASAIPLSENEQDRAAADEANYIIKHYARKFGRETQLKERVRWACVCGTSYLKIYWDSNKSQVVPQYEVSGKEVIGHKEFEVGDVVEQILPAFDVYLDPTAKQDEDVRWLIHAMVKPLSWFVNSYGEIGKRVKADALTGHNASYVDNYLDGASGTGFGYTNPTPARQTSYDARKHAATVYEYWEKPSALYPKGRYIVSTNSQLLYAGIWPYEKRDSFPFIPLRWQPRAGTPYGYALGFDLTQLQLMYNRLWSKLLEQFEGQKDYLMIERLSKIGADAFDNKSDTIDDANRIYRKIYYDRGSHPPQIMRAPGVGSDIFPILQFIEKDMADIAGLHDVSQGMAQAGTPAEAVRLLQKADNTQHSYVRADIEISNYKIKEWEVSLVQQFAIVPFVGNMQDEAMPQDQIKQGVMRFDAIRNGGQFRIVYVPGSAMDDGPEARLQKYATLRQMGVFGDPADPDTNKLFIELVNMPEASKILEHLDNQQEKIKQAQVQQQQMMQAQMEMQAQQQQQQPQSTFNPEEEQMKAEIEIAKKRAEIQAKLEADIALLTAKAGLESQDEEGMQEMPFPGSTEPMEEDFVNPDDEQEQPDMSDPESAGQNVMQMLSGTGGMQEQQPPMDQQQMLPQEDVGNTEGIEGIL
jgi:hypothetical protein